MPEQEDWRIVDVAALPWPHLLFRCEWRERTTSLVEKLDGSARQEAVRSAVLGLRPDEVAACDYHLPDWHRAAATAVALIEDTGQLPWDALDEAARSMDDQTRWALYSFTFEPIIWSGGERLQNGQHRVCAMKLAGVARCPVVGA